MSPQGGRATGPVRRALDAIYLGAAVLAAASIAGLCLMVSAQILLNLVTRLGLPLPPAIPSYADFAGFMLSAATFLALPWTLRTGGHVRVGLVTQRLPQKLRWPLELAVLALATAMIGFAAWSAAGLTAESFRYGDTSPGIVPIPLFVPQAVMVAGLTLLVAALLDTAIGTWIARDPILPEGGEA